MNICSFKLLNRIPALSGSARMRSFSGENSSLMETVEKMRHKVDNEAQSPWDELWKDNLTPWDLGRPTPLLIFELEKIRSKIMQKPHRYRSLVPGCGGGHDLKTLIAHQNAIVGEGDNQIESIVVGVDISSTALKQAETKVKDDATLQFDLTRLYLNLGDFFANQSDWTVVFQSNENDVAKKYSSFDFIFDYTFFCALPPLLRPKWGEQMAKLLERNNGRLLTIIFPILPRAEMRGPPYPVSVQDYIDVLKPHDIVMDGEPFESPHSVPSRAGKELVCYWKHNYTAKTSEVQSSL